MAGGGNDPDEVDDLIIKINLNFNVPSCRCNLAAIESSLEPS